MNNSANKKLDQIIELMESDDSVDAPMESITWAKNLYRTRQKKPFLIKRFVASLQMDIPAGKPAFGERSRSAGSSRQMLFNAGEHAIELRISSESSHVSMNGQVLGDGFAGAEFAVSSGALQRTMTLGRMSEFEMLDLPKGFYTLTIRSQEKEIVIENVDI